MMRKSHSLAVAIAATLLVATGCSDSGTSDDTANPPTADAATDTTNGDEPATGSPAAVSIVDFAYDPAGIEIAVGDTVTFTNEDAATHTATSEEDAPVAFDSDDLDEGATTDVTFDEPGDYPYCCSIHEYMKGNIRVPE